MNIEKTSRKVSITLTSTTIERLGVMAKRERVLLETLIESLLETTANNCQRRRHRWSLAEIKRDEYKREFTAQIVNRATSFFGITRDEMLARCRIPTLVDCRTALAGYLYMEAHLTLAAVGMLLGDRDHTTIRYGVQNHNLWLTNNKPYRDMYMSMKEMIETI